MDVAQFGQTIKQKYPQYQNIDDSTLGQKMLDKYPQYQSKITTQSEPSLGDKIKSINPVNLYTGAAKGVLSTVGGLEQLGEKIFNPIVQKITGSKINTGNIPQQVEQAATPSNVGQSIGKTGEQIGEFFIPAGEVAKAGKIAEAGIEGAKLPSLLEKGAKLATKSGLGAAEVGGVTAAQTGSPEQAKQGAEIGAFLPVVGAVAGRLFQGAGEMAKGLEETSLRLTPTQKSNLGQKLNDVTNFMLGNKITGTPEVRLNKVTDIYKGMEGMLQDFLTKEAKDVSVPTKDIIGKLEGLKSSLGADNIDAPAIERKIENAINVIKTKYGESIPVANLNKLKRSAFNATYNESGLKILDPTMQEVGGVLKNTIEDATKGLQIAGKDIEGFNKEYGTVINARKLLKTAVGRNQLGLYGNLTARFLGGMIGSIAGLPGEVAGVTLAPSAAEFLTGTAARSRVAGALDYLSKLGRVTDTEVNNIKSFFLGGGKTSLTPKEEAIAKKITQGIKGMEGKGGMSISADKEAMQNTADAVYSGLKKLDSSAKPMQLSIADQTFIDDTMKAIEKGTQTPEQVRSAMEMLKLNGIDVGNKVDITGAALPKSESPLIQEAKKYKSAEEFYQTMPSKLRDELRAKDIKGREQITKVWEESTGKKAVDSYQMTHRPTETGATAADISANGTIPKDFYDHPEWYINIRSDKNYQESFAALQKVRNNPDAEITIYRAAPKNELNKGDWVTLSKGYAKQESLSEGTPVHAFKVKAKDIQFAGDDINEFGYYPKEKLTDIWNKAHGKTVKPQSFKRG